MYGGMGLGGVRAHGVKGPQVEARPGWWGLYHLSPVRGAPAYNLPNFMPWTNESPSATIHRSPDYESVC